MPEDITTTQPTEAKKRDFQKPRSMSAASQSLQAERFRGLNQKAAAALGRTASEPANNPSTSLAGIPSARPRLILLSPQMVTRRSPLQTRPPFDPVQNLEDGEFARSVKDHGVIQPILVYRIEGEATLEAEYGLISGHRRLDAALYNHLTSIPALVMPPETSVENRDILALLENLQRKDLEPVEKAGQIQRLMDTYGYNHREVADLIGLSESHLSSLLSLLSAPPEVQEAVSSGKLGVRNARKVIQMSEPKRRQVLDLTRDGLTLTDALEEASANPETEPEGKNPIKSKKGGSLPEAPDTARIKDEIGAVARRSAEPARGAASPLMQMLGEQNDAFKQVLHDRSLVSLLPPKHYLLMAIIWRSSGSNTQLAVATYQSLTNAAKNELEKAISSISKLSVLPRRPRDAKGEDLVAAYLSMAIQILLQR